ncbi:MAG: toprim domain-containing protein [Pseudomonadota bacterium]
MEEQARDGHESPKYFNGIESEIYQKQRVLYGLSRARSAIQRENRALLVEGYFDVVSLAQGGIEETVATCGTALTAEQIKLLRRLSPNVVALFDSDQAGIKAAVRSMELFAEAEMEAFRLTIPGAKDPDELVREQGPEAFRALLGNTEPLMDLVIRWHADQQGATPLGRQRALAEIAPLVARFPEVARAALIQRVADLLVLPEAQVARQVRGVRLGPGHGPAQVERPAATRFTKDIHHLFWLLVQFPEKVRPALEASDPTLISESHAVLDAMGALLQGRPVPAVMEDCADEGLRALLAAVAAMDGLYKEESAENAVQRILARLEIPRIDQRLVELHRAFEAATDKQGEEARALLTERTRLTLLRMRFRQFVKGQ